MENKSIFIVFKVARQVDGEFVFVSCLKAFSSAEEATKFANKESKANQLIPLPDGNKVECFVEVGIHNVELD